MTTNAKIKKLIDDNEVLLFMKGNPTFPQCGFSSVACQALGGLDAPFEQIDVRYRTIKCRSNTWTIYLCLIPTDCVSVDEKARSNDNL